DPLPEDHVFLSSNDGRPVEMVQLYVDLRNFANPLQGDSYITRLDSALKIVDDRGNVVWSQTFPSQDSYSDRSRSPRKDYFMNYRFPVPPKLPRGHYTLSIEIIDLLSQPKRKATRSLPFPVLVSNCMRGCQGDATDPSREHGEPFRWFGWFGDR